MPSSSSTITSASAARLLSTTQTTTTTTNPSAAPKLHDDIELQIFFPTKKVPSSSSNRPNIPSPTIGRGSLDSAVSASTDQSRREGMTAADKREDRAKQTDDMAARALSKNDKVKRGVWAVAFAAVIFVGTLTGAQLKNDAQKEETISQFRTTTPAEQIAALEQQKKVLLDQKAAMERKMDAFRERVRDREEKAKKAVIAKS